MTSLDIAVQRPVSDALGTLLIDTDVHEELPSLEALIPHIDAVWRPFLDPGDIDHLWGFTGVQPYAAPTGAGRRDWTLPNGKRHAADPKATAQHLFDEQGVSHAILCGAFRPGAMRTDYEFARALASAYNDWLIEEWLESDPRFFGSVHIVPDRPDEAVREIERVGGHPQIVQVFIPTVTDRQFGDPFYQPIYEAAVGQGLVVAFHHLGIATKTVLGFPRYYVEWHTLAAPQAAMGQLTSLVFNGVFDRNPGLKVCFLEGGVSWVPPFLGRLDQQYREMRTNVPWVKRAPSDHIRNAVRFSTQPFTEVKPSDFAAMVAMYESEALFLFATDYPHYDADAATVINGLPRPLQSRIRYENALVTYPRLTGIAG